MGEWTARSRDLRHVRPVVDAVQRLAVPARREGDLDAQALSAPTARGRGEQARADPDEDRQRTADLGIRPFAAAALLARTLNPDGKSRKLVTARPADRSDTRAMLGVTALPATKRTGAQYAARGNTPRQVVPPWRTRAYSGAVPADALPKKSCACTDACRSVAIGSMIA